MQPAHCEANGIIQLSDLQSASGAEQRHLTGRWVDEASLAHCCTLFLCYLVAETDDQHRNPNIKNRDNLVARLTNAHMDKHVRWGNICCQQTKQRTIK